MADVSLDPQEQIARIDRMQDETHKFAAEHRKIDRDYSLSGWQLAIAGMTAGAALIDATAAFIKIFG